MKLGTLSLFDARRVTLQSFFAFVSLLSLTILPADLRAYDAQDNSEADHDHATFENSVLKNSVLKNRGHTESSPEASQKAESPESPDARPQMIKITAKGVTPSNLTMLQSDSVVFFYNDTDDDLVTLEVEFGSRAVHCAAALKVVKEPGLARSRKPFGPKEFASTCFHEKGLYPYRIYTSKKGKAPYSGTVTVQ